MKKPLQYFIQISITQSHHNKKPNLNLKKPKDTTTPFIT